MAGRSLPSSSPTYPVLVVKRFRNMSEAMIERPNRYSSTIWKSQGKQQERYARKRRNVLGKEQENIDRHQYRHEKPVEMALAGKPDVQTLKMLH